MKRARRPNKPINKPFVSGGIYNPNANPKSPLGPNAEEQPPQKQQKLDPLAVVVPTPPAAASVPVAAVPAVPVPMEQLDAATIAAMLPLPILIKEEPAEEPVENISIDLNKHKGKGGKIHFKKVFQKRRKTSERTRDKKLRQNRELRKSMLPKNALMALNEVKGVTISDFIIDSNPDGGFNAVVTVNSNQYEGKGPSKMSAKNAASEKAWRDIIIAKMTKKSASLQPAIINEANGIQPMDTNEDGVELPEEDDLPMLNMASFAIYKMFAEWEREGYIVPEMHPSAASTSLPSAGSDTAAPPTRKEKKPPVRAELPSGWETMHPATLLCIMRPGVTYVDYGTSGDKPNVLQHLGIVVDDQEFTANGRSKKIARRNVAVSVCNTLFGTNFSFENPPA